jgi:hypothetical protein
VEKQAEQADNDDAPNPEVTKPEAASETTAPAVVTPVFNIAANSARCPFHVHQFARLDTPSTWSWQLSLTNAVRR